MAFIPAIELASADEQAHFQSEKLQVALAYLQQHSPFYQRLFKEQGVDIKEIRTLSDLEQLPVTGKEDLQVHNTDFLCVPPGQVREYTATSGTVGKPVIVALTQADLGRLAYNEFLSFHCMQAGPDDIFQLMLTLDRQFMAGIAYYQGLGRLGAAAIRTGPGLPGMQWDTINQLGTTALVAVPSFLLKMLEHARQTGIRPEMTTVRRILAIGESLRDDNLEDNALARQIRQEWDIALHGTYASTEMQTAFTECTAGRGGHHHPELIITELLDEAGKPVAPGEKGEVTITTLGVEGMPLLRYRTGDICRGYYTPCSCGRRTMRLGPVLGRKQQMIKLKGTTLFPPAIFDLLNGLKEIKEYVVAVETGLYEQDSLRIFIHSDLVAGDLENLLLPLIRHKWRVLPEITYCSAAEIQRMQYPGNLRKPVKFIDKRKTYS